MKKPDIIICGAGIAGVACAYYLSHKYQYRNIVLIDKLAPLSFTTSQSGENFREYWPQPCMNEFVSHSIDLMEELLNEYPGEFKMSYSGYDFVSHEKGSQIFPVDPNLQEDVFTVLRDQSQIHLQKPYLDESVQQVVHINRGGAIDVYSLGSLMLKLARQKGVTFIQSEIRNIKKHADSYHVEIGNEETLRTGQLVICAGPFTPNLARHLNIELPVYSVPQRKFVIPDPENIIPRDMPFTIYADRQRLTWTDEELELIGDDEQYSHLLEEYPAGLHIKPEGHNQIKLGWAFNKMAEKPQWDIETDPNFADIVIRGATRFIPALNSYVNNIPTPIVQFAGYYTRTRENLPLIGKLDDNLFVASAMAGYGTMAACAAGQLCADHLSQSGLPGYAKYFEPYRWQNNSLMNGISAIQGDGQL